MLLSAADLEYALKLKKQWAGHISRYTDRRWTLLITKWKGPKGKRNVGRPKKRWADDIISIAGRNWTRQGGMEKDGGGFYPKWGPYQ